MPTKKPDPEGKVLSKDPTKGKKKPAAPKKRKPHYVDNKKFLESIPWRMFLKDCYTLIIQT